jgi:O-antigen ligase
MSGHAADATSKGDVAGALSVGSGGGRYSATLVAGPSFAFLPAWLAIAFLIAAPIPGLVDLLDGASLALLTMLAATPIWYEAARARHSPFDTVASTAISIILVCAGFLIFWSLISVIGATSPLRASRYIATLIAAFSIYYLVRSTVTQKRLALYVDLLAAGLAVSSAVSLLAFEVDGLRDLIFRGTDRAAGFFKNPNQFGMAISTTLPAVMALLLAERERRWFRVGCVILMLLGLVVSGSKTNLLLVWATLLATLCGYAWISHTGARRIAVLALSTFGSLAFAGLGVLALSLFNPRALGIMLGFFSGDGEVDSLMTRSFLWTYSIEQFLADPILGQGAGQRIDIFYRAEDVSHSHNVLLDYMRTLGIPGLFGVALMIGTVVLVCLLSIERALRQTGGSPAARLLCLGLSLNCLSYVAANMSSDSFGPSTSPFFWLFAYLAFASRGLMRSLPNVVVPRRPKANRRVDLNRLPGLVGQDAIKT